MIVVVTILVVVGVLVVVFVYGGGMGNRIGRPPSEDFPGEGTKVAVPTLPPSWTATSTPTQTPTPTGTPTVTPAPTKTPFPDFYQDSAWVIAIEAPSGWRGANNLVELSDGAIIVAGAIKVGINHETIWLARISTVGAVDWVKSLTLPGGGTFYINSLAAGPDGSTLLSGDYNPPGGRGATEIDDVMISVDMEGMLEWQVWGYSRKTQVLDDGALMLIDRLGVARWPSDRASEWRASLDFGAGYIEPPDYYPIPQLVEGYRLPDGTLLFSGTIEDLVVPGDGIARGGPDPGFINYWYAAFSAQGDLRWKHFYAIDGTEQFRIYGDAYDDGSLVLGGSKIQRVQTERDLYNLPLYSWVRRMSSNGRTLFHQRYLDLPRLDGIEATIDGGMLLHGVNFEPEGENVFGIEQPRIVKLDADGNVEWARQFQDDLRLRAVVPLSDGTYLISFGYDLAFARLDAQGFVAGCPQISNADMRMRVDNEPAQFDAADTIPLSLITAESDTERSAPPNLSLSSMNLTTIELCRTFPAEE
jgi:hypothetical protein